MASGRQERTDDVEPAAVILTGVGDVAQAERQADDGEGDRHGEEPRPGEVVDQERRDEQAEDATGTGEAGPDADRPGPVFLAGRSR